MAIPVFVGVGTITVALQSADQWVKGGYIAILGLKEGVKLRNKLKDAHHHIVLANKINEAKDLLDETDGNSR
ncbi:hypothetical protein DEU56DRAFT_778246 [Suillus clintonianus]|uniref:uncharacterized protein n=1 Tax=Suillus clintonianus TaxID=1904413 RepID=UPI001B86952D|nr:uncharacterized protein DEU56DRAFT_778246 [Suillus clintonianus]KAG2151500.1 hypothetical protein DEU56DRAFT_778246 [Suillus clintonianus]